MCVLQEESLVGLAKGGNRDSQCYSSGQISPVVHRKDSLTKR